MVFRTNNSIYVVDLQNKVISGGIFGDRSYNYVNLSAMIGAKAIIELADGRIVTTSKVVAYV